MSQKQIDYIMDTFDFHRVQLTMELLQWKWHTDAGLCVPGLLELRQKARGLLKEVSHWRVPMSSGGFYADYVYDVLGLKFVLEDAYGVD